VDALRAAEGARASGLMDALEAGLSKTVWVCEQWSEEACVFARKRLGLDARAEVGSHLLRALVPVEMRYEVHGNLMLNEGLTRLRDLLIVAGGTGYNNANSYVGVGDTLTAEAATQTELQATAAAANRFYKIVNAGSPTSGTNAASWAADFTTSEANFVWNEWTIASGATGASGAGFLTGTTNLNRKVQALGTKATGTWTLTGTVTFS
jgi:hypothetical protein